MLSSLLFKPKHKQAVVKDDFTDTRSAGAVNGTPATPGPGVRTTSAGVSVGSGHLVLPGTAESYLLAKAAGASDIARVAGRVIRWKFDTTPTAGAGYWALFEAGDNKQSYYLYYVGGPDSFRIGCYEKLIDAITYTRREIDHPNGKVQLGFLLGSDNTRYFLADDFWMQLAWVSIDDPGAGNFRLGTASSTLNGSIDNVQVQDTTIPTLAGCAFFDVTNPVTGTEYEATDGDDQGLGMAFHIINITAPDPLSGNVKIYLRYLDADNYLSVEFNAAGDVLFRQRIAGVNVDSTDAAKITAGASVTLYVHLTEYYCDIYARIGNSFVTSYAALHKWISIAQLWQNFAEATVKVQSASDYAVTRWRAWPLVSTKYGQISTPRIGKSFLSVGDSKTANYEWQGPMLTALNALAVHQWKEFPGSISAGGWWVSQCQAAIDAAIAARYSYPDHILINLGSNDVNALPAEATWKADYCYIIEALHIAYPNAKIYLAKPVLLDGAPPSTPVADCATMWGWIDDLVAMYDYTYPGLDETDLEGGDGYATNFTDATHYAAAGFSTIANLWKTAIGY